MPNPESESGEVLPATDEEIVEFLMAQTSRRNWSRVDIEVDDGASPLLAGEPGAAGG